MIYLILFLAFVLFSIGSSFSYRKEIHQYRWFPAVMCCVSLCGGFLWAMLCRITPDKNKIMIFSVYWDIMMAIAYYMVPLLFGNFQLTATSVFGIIIVCVGLSIIHLG
jgi:hypothetical protein